MSERPTWLSPNIEMADNDAKPKIGCIGGIRLIANKNIAPGTIVLVSADALASVLCFPGINDPSRWVWKEPVHHVNIGADDALWGWGSNFPAWEPKEADHEP